MSVRRETMSGSAVNSTGWMKSTVFWVAMLTASFLLGFLVIAPLAQLVRGRGEVSHTQAHTPPSNQAPPPSPSHAVAPTQHKLNVPPNEDIEITPERSQEGVTIQPADDANGHKSEAGSDHSRREDGAAPTDAASPRTEDRGAATSGADTGATDDRATRRTDRTPGERRSRRDNGDDSEQPGATIDDSGRTSQTGGGEVFSPRRSRRSRSTGDTRRGRDDADVQTGEKIDK